MIRYDHSKGEVTIFENFKGRVAMSVMDPRNLSYSIYKERTTKPSSA